VSSADAPLGRSRLDPDAIKALPQRILDNLLEGCQVIGFDWEYLYVNEAAARHGRKSREELLGKTMIQAYSGIEDSRMFGVLRECMAERKPDRMENEFAFPDGSKGWFELSFEPVPEGMLILSQDITDRKRAEAELREREKFITAVMDHLPIGIAVNSIDPSVKFSYMNDNFPLFYRTTREALADPDGFWDAVYEDPEFREQIRKRVLDDCASGDPDRMQWDDIPISRKGEETSFICARNTPVPGKDLMISTVWDVTKRKRAEERIAHLNAMLRGIRNVNQLIVREKDHTRLIKQACESLVESRGLMSAILGLLDDSGTKVGLYAGAGEELSSLREALEFGNAPDCGRQAMANQSLVLRSNAGRACPEAPDCPGAKAPLGPRDTICIDLSCHGKVYGFLLACLPMGTGGDSEEQGLLREVADDIAFALHGMEARIELAHTEEQLRQAQKLEAIGRLAGGVAHDFNNLMTVVTGYSELLKAKVEAEPEALRDVDEISKAGHRATQLTRQLLAFSRKQVLNPEEINLNDVIKGVSDMLRRLIGEDVELDIVTKPDLGIVRADKGQIEQILMNLAVNAKDAMPSGGKLLVETANVDLDESYASNHVSVEPGPHVMMAVTDNGSGMNQEVMENLFEPFFTTKDSGKGTGLGLSTVYGIVKQSGGNIWVYSEPGKGTTFKIYFPAAREEGTATRQRKSLEARKAKQGSETILLVEDDDSVRAVIQAMLEDSGYKLLEARDGEEALQINREHDGNIDLLLSDVVMPGMSGRELAIEMVKLNPRLTVLFMSGYTDNAIHHHGVLDPDIAYIEKPFSPATLTRKIREVLSGD